MSKHIIETNQDKLHSKISGLSIETLKEAAVKLMYDKRNEAGIVLDEIINSLETRMEESEFIKFCDEL